jgi:NAD-dependent DNA ligase
MEPKHKIFLRKANLDRTINELLGIFEGISIDGKINQKENQFISSWILFHENMITSHPFTELVPLLTKAIQDGVIDDEEKSDIQWLCNKLRSKDYFDQITADLQSLQSVLAGIISDGTISTEEIKNLSDWMENHAHLRRCWPYDEIDSLITVVLKDQKIDQAEQNMLMDYFSEFSGELPVGLKKTSVLTTVHGICAVTPEIKFPHSAFCFTGESHKLSRFDFEDLVLDHGGRVVNSVTSVTDYLIVGTSGNPCWAYACYGRKIEKAVGLRKQGHTVLIVHENDFHDAVR